LFSIPFLTPSYLVQPGAHGTLESATDMDSLPVLFFSCLISQVLSELLSYSSPLRRLTDGRIPPPSLANFKNRVNSHERVFPVYPSRMTELLDIVSSPFFSIFSFSLDVLQ